MRQYIDDIDPIISPAFLELIQFWWLVVNAKEIYHPHPFGNAINSNTYQNVCTFLRQMNEWLEIWSCSAKLGLSNQTFNALIVTNNAISDLTCDLIEEGLKFVLTGRLQTDPLERRFSQYRGMSAGSLPCQFNRSATI